MKFKRTVFLTAVVIALGVLLGTGAAQAATVIFDPDNPTQATGITGLVVGPNIYDVSFTEKNTGIRPLRPIRIAGIRL